MERRLLRTAIIAVVGALGLSSQSAWGQPIAEPCLYMLTDDGRVRNLTVVDTSTGAIRAQVPAPPVAVSGLAVSADGATVYVAATRLSPTNACPVASQVLVVDVNRARVRHTLPIANPGLADSIVLSADGHRLYVTDVRQGRLYVVNVDLLTVRGSVQLRYGGDECPQRPDHPIGGPDLIALTPDGRKAYVTSTVCTIACFTALSVIDTSALSAMTLLDRHIDDVAVSADGRFAYVAMAGETPEGLPGHLLVLDTSTDAVVADLPLGAFRVWATPAAVYAALNAGTAIIDPFTHTVRRTVGYGGIPDAAGRRLYGFDSLGQNLLIADPVTDHIETVPLAIVPAFPLVIAACPQGAAVTPSPTPTATPVTPSPTPTLTATPRAGRLCVGDCNRDGTVSVDDLIAMVEVALGRAGVGSCRGGDVNGDEAITVDEILTAVRHAMLGCARDCRDAGCPLGTTCGCCCGAWVCSPPVTICCALVCSS